MSATEASQLEEWGAVLEWLRTWGDPDSAVQVGADVVEELLAEVRLLRDENQRLRTERESLMMGIEQAEDA